MAAGFSVERDWYTHDGGDAPAVSKGLDIEVKFRTSDVVRFTSANHANCVWRNLDGSPGADIVAWRPAANQVLPADFFQKLCGEDQPGIIVDPSLPEVAAVEQSFQAFDKSVGDINSDAKGSGARYNGGKPPFELVPLTAMVAALNIEYKAASDVQRRVLFALQYLGEWQSRTEPGDGNAFLYEAASVLGSDGWAECADVFDYGRRKYAEWNWAKGMSWSVPFACAVRHLLAMLRGEVNDPESGKPHRGHVKCNLAMLMTYETTFPEGDDRPAKGLL